MTTVIVAVFLFLFCHNSSALTLKNDRISVEIDDNAGNLNGIVDQKNGQKLVIPGYDYYKLQPSPDREILADEKEDRVIRKEGNKLICTNPKLTQILVEKEYSLDNKMLTKKVTFRAEGKDLGFLKYNTKTNLDQSFYLSGYLNNPSRHVRGAQMPYIPVEDIKNEMQIFDVNPKADHHLAIFTNPVIKKGLAQYRFKVDGYFTNSLTSYAYEPGLYYSPEGWRMAVAAKWLSSDRPLFSCEVRWHVFDGDHLKFHQEYLELPEFREIWDTKIPDWMREVKGCTGWNFGGSSMRHLENIKKYADSLDTGYLMVLIGGIFTNIRDYLADPIPASIGIPLPASKLREVVDRLHQLSPKIKVGPITWMWGFGKKDPIFLKKPEWTVHDAYGKPVFGATGWENEPISQQLITPECRQFLIEQFRGAVKKFNFDFIYMDSGQGGVTSLDWQTKNCAQDYDWALLYKGMLESARSNNGGTFFNGMSNIFSLYSDFGFYEGVGIFQRDHWQALSDRLLLGKLYQKPEGKRVIPIYWNANVKESFAKNCFVLALTPLEFGGASLDNKWPITHSLYEIQEAILVPEAEVSPCWWKEKTDIEAYGLKIGNAAFLTVHNHSKNQENVNLKANLNALGFGSNKPLNAWLFEPKSVSEVENEMVATASEVAEVFQKEGKAPLRGVKASFVGSLPYPKDGQFSHQITVDSDRVILLMLTQAEELRYAKDGIPTHFLLPATADPKEKTIKANQPLPAEIQNARNWSFPADRKKLVAPPSSQSSPSTVNIKKEGINKTIKGIKVFNAILIDCEHNFEDTASVDLDNLILTANMGEEKIWGFASSAIESSNLGKLKLKVSAGRPFFILPSNVEPFAGLVVDYQTDKGYTKRVYYSFLSKAGKRARPWYGYFDTKGEKEEPVYVNLSDKISPDKENLLELDLGEYAPEKWNGKTVFAVQVDCCELTRKVEVQILENSPAGKRKIEVKKEKIIYKDDFSGYAEGDDGSPEWSPIKGKWQMENGEYCQIAGNIQDARTLNKKVKLPDKFMYEAKAKMIDSDHAGIMFGMPDENNGYIFWISSYEPNPQIALQKMTDGARLDLVQRMKEPHSKNQWYTLKVVVEGNSIKTFVDGILKQDIKDENFSSGAIGLWTFTKKACFDDIIIKQVGEETFEKPAPAVEKGGVEFQGGAIIHKFEKGAKLEDKIIHIPVDGTIEATGLSITTLKVVREPGSSQLELWVNYQKQDGKYQLYRYSFGEVKPGSEKEINFDFNAFAPKDWNKRCRIELKGDRSSVKIIFNSSFQIF